MRLIDADALKDWSEIVPLTGDGGIDINDFDEKLKSMPTVDAVPVVRCKDCKHWYKGENINYCRRFWDDDGEPKLYRCVAEDYCSRAERKEE